MNIVGIDPSLISTGLCVNGKLFNYAKEKNACTKSGLKKWFALAEHVISYRYVNYREHDDYSTQEIMKLEDYGKVTDDIVLDILRNIDRTQPTAVAIEGYSYSSTSGNALIDLVTFSTLLRTKIIKNVTSDLTVMSPSTLKMETAKLTYQPKIEGTVKKPKEVYYNLEGVKGGLFTKREMFLAICDNSNINSQYRDLLLSLKSEAMNMTSIPKPLEDCNDSFALYQILKKQRGS